MNIEKLLLSQEGFGVKPLIQTRLMRLKTPYTWGQIWNQYYDSIKHEVSKPQMKKMTFSRSIFCNQHYGRSCVTTSAKLYYSKFVFAISEHEAQKNNLCTGNGQLRTTFAVPLFLIPMKKLSLYGKLIDRYSVPIIGHDDISSIDDRYSPLPWEKKSQEWREFKKREIAFVESLLREEKTNEEVLIFFMLKTSAK